MNTPTQPWSIDPENFPADAFAADQLEFLLGYAILAPSTHNTQPWHFRINAMDVELFADWSRRLAVVDPQGRELVMSCGAALFNLRVAAEYFEKGWRVEVCPDPQQPLLLARLHLGLQAETSSEDVLLFNAITQRHTNRGPLRFDPLPDDLIEDCVTIAQREGAWLMLADSDDTRGALADLVAEADRQQWAHHAFRQELAGWLRTKPGSALDGIPVQDLGVQDWLSFAGPSLIRTFDRGKGQAARDREIAMHSPALIVLGTDQDDTPAWLAAGQALQGILLRARSEEVWASFLCQPLELPELRDQVAAMCGRPNPQVILRMGFGEPAPPTPRRGVRQVLLRQPEAHHG
jgi:nitroreductase